MTSAAPVARRRSYRGKFKIQTQDSFHAKATPQKSTFFKNNLNNNQLDEEEDHEEESGGEYESH